MDPLLDTAPCGYICFNDQGYVTAVNQTLAEQLGYSKEELLKTRFEHLLNIAGRIFFQTHFFPLLKLHHKAEEIFLSLLAKNNELVPVICNAKRTEAEDTGFNTCVFVPVHNRRKYEDEILEARRRAEEALFDNKQLTAAREEADAQARELDKQLGKLNEINYELLQFNHIIHHDMQECIRKILVFSKLAETDTDENYFKKITETANRLSMINSSLDVFIKLGINADNYQEVRIADILEEAKASILKSTGFKGLVLEYAKLPVIDAAPEQLKLLFYHLLSNSIRFRKGELAHVEVSAVLYQENIFRHSERRFKYVDVLRLSISDDGQGFDSRNSQYVFGLMKKLDKGGAGNGIGLAICKKVVENHHGEISIASTEGIGTRVSIILPVRQHALEQGEDQI